MSGIATPPAPHTESTRLVASIDTAWDVAIIGAGPAGAAVAVALARAGHSTLLVDKSRFPRAKVCGCCLNSSALGSLNRLGLTELADSGAPLTNIRLAAGGRTAALPLTGGASLSRSALDAGLAAAAVRAGATFVDDVTAAIGAADGDGRAVRLEQHGHRIEIRAKLVVAATGLAGLRFSGADEVRPRVPRASRIGAGAIALAAPEYYRAGAVYMACAPHGYLGMVRLEDGRLDLAAALDSNFLRSAGGPARAATIILADAGLPALPEIEQLPWQGTPALTRRIAQPAAERLLVLGDAAGYVEPFTGEGIAWALAAAEAAAPLASRAIDRWESSLTAEWTRIYGRLIKPRQRTCRVVAGVLRHPLAVRSLVRVLAHVPQLASPVLRHLSRR